MSAQGLYYDGEHARATAVAWSVADGRLRIEGEGVLREEPVAGLRGTTRLGQVRRAIVLPDGAQLQSDDQDAVDALFPRRGIETVVDRLERHPAAVAASLLVTVLGGVLFVAFGLPWLADRVARAVPPAVEGPMGEQVLSALDSLALSPSTLSPAEQARWREAFDRFMAPRADAAQFRLAFRDLADGGANAFAVPGGTIVFTDGLLRSIAHEEEFFAVLAHELGHHADRHVLRGVLQQSALAVLLATLTGDVGSATGVIVAVPSFLLENHYSRDFEREADAFAFRELAARGISPAWFAVAMARISRGYRADRDEDGEPDADYASSHPSTDERLAAARDAASAAVGVPELALAVARRGETEAPQPDWPARVDVGAAELAGCWRGRLEESEWPYEWFAQRRADGAFTVDFRGLDAPEEDFAGSREVGRWAVHDGIMATYAWSTRADGTPAGDDNVLSYRIEAFDGRTLSYRSLDDEDRTVFDSEQVDCAEAWRAADGSDPPLSPTRP